MRPPLDDAKCDRHMEELVRVCAEMDTFLVYRCCLFSDAVRWATQQESTGGPNILRNAMQNSLVVLDQLGHAAAVQAKKQQPTPQAQGPSAAQTTSDEVDEFEQYLLALKDIYGEGPAPWPLGILRLSSRELREVENIDLAHPPEEFVIKGEPLNVADRERGAEKMRPSPDDAEHDRHMEELVRVRAEMDTFRADMRSLFRTDAVHWATQQEATGGTDADYDNADDPAPGKKEVADNRLVLEGLRKALEKRKLPADWSVINGNKMRSQFCTLLAECCARALEDAEAGIYSCEQAVTTVLADTFSKCTSMRTQTMSCMSQRDCQQSLTAASELLGSDMCCPVFVSTGKGGQACPTMCACVWARA
eukprot:m51a1_g5132 hypothetical protein (363) ;mRNA; f:414644-417948